MNANSTTAVDVNQMTWSLLRRHLKIFLDTTWVQGYQVIIFRHSSIEQVHTMIMINLYLLDSFFLENSTTLFER